MRIHAAFKLGWQKGRNGSIYDEIGWVRRPVGNGGTGFLRTELPQREGLAKIIEGRINFGSKDTESDAITTKSIAQDSAGSHYSAQSRVVS